MILLTTETGFLKPIAWFLGKIFDWLFMLVTSIAKIPHLGFIANIGLCVILFTIIVRLIMLPLTVKQQKFSKLSSMMNPEIQAIQAKYKDKKDNQSMLKMQEETKAVYAKYGTSPTGGCLTMIIQLPIMFALYRVIYKIPGYVTRIKELCTGIANIPGIQDAMVDEGIIDETYSSTNKFIDAMYNYSSNTWDDIKGLFEKGAYENSDHLKVVTDNSDHLIKYTTFFGISLTQAPGWHLSWALLIPILAGISQWVSSKLMETSNKNNGMQQQPGGMANSMKVMNTVMPIMSAVFCVTFPSCIGLYWITSSVVQIVIQLIINRKMNKIDVEEMVQQNIDKVNEKRAKKGLPPKKITNTATSYVEQVKKQEAIDSRKGERDEAIKNSTSYYNENAKAGSLASKANMVKMFNERNNKKDE